METSLIITPKSKVLQVIEAYPQLEDVLISYVPAFVKLKNPVLRKTVARIATLQQAAAIGNVPVGELINRLRKEVGQDLLTVDGEMELKTVKPAWFNENSVDMRFDAREMLAAGEQPVNQVIADLNNLSGDSIYELTAPFIPAPLIEKATSLNIDHWMLKQDDEHYIIYFRKKS